MKNGTNVNVKKELYIPIWFYSNFVVFLKSLINSNFTFQSGSILMEEDVCVEVKHDNLYIPIWFYSNSLCTAKSAGAFRLYIPIWFYSNQAGYEERAAFILFTFQSGSILMKMLPL